MSDVANETMSADEYRTRHMSEEAIHKAVVDWADRQAQAEPALELLFHPANGGKMPNGTAGKMVGFGLRQGVPDLLLPYAMPDASGGTSSGLALELKSPSGRLRDKQKWWLRRFLGQGWAVAVAWSIDEAIYVIQRYLDGEYRQLELDLSGAEPPRHVGGDE